MPSPGPERPPEREIEPDLDAARGLVVDRGLAGAAFGHLTVDAFLSLPFEAVGPTKALLKRFFSTGPWEQADDDALAAAVGPGEGQWQHALDDDLTLRYGWSAGRFEVSLSSRLAGTARAVAPPLVDPLADTFDGPVVPEATPNPRTIRFQVGHLHDGPSRWYESATAAADDPVAARLFATFAEVANVLVGPDFVAVGLRRAADWERLLRPVMAMVTEELASAGGVDESPPRVKGGPAGAVGAGAEERAAPGSRRSRLEEAWAELGSLHPAMADDLDRVRAGAHSDDPARRQVAASLLREADPAVAATEWGRLAADPVRSVRRAAVDAMVDAGREDLRLVLEIALGDSDAWVRWKALRGLAELGAEASRPTIAPLSGDPDFRVRLEAAAALRTS